jgi:hypothetical protein
VLVSPIGIAPFFSRYGLDVLISEVVWIWIPVGVLVGSMNFWRTFTR